MHSVLIATNVSCSNDNVPMRGVLDTIECDKICQGLAAGGWFCPGTPVSSTKKTNRHAIAEILLIAALKHHTLALTLALWYSVFD